MKFPMGSSELSWNAEQQMKRGSALTAIANLIQKSEDAKCHEGGEPFLGVSEFDGLACAIELIARDMLIDSERWVDLSKRAEK